MTTTEKYDREAQQPYFQSIKELLDKYEDGWNVFIKAHEEKDFDLPVPRKPEFADDPYLPQTWLGLADRVISIIAHEKYKLETNPNRIEIVRADQMLDAYVRPVPNGPHHWQYGKRRAIEQKQYDASKHLAYEIIINSNPALAYCMDTNTPVMQMLVFAHASYGHNAVYKNNFLFESQSDPDMIMDINKRYKKLVEECEEKYGIEEVERMIDFCESMRFMDTSVDPKPRHVSKKERAGKAKKAREKGFLSPPTERIFNRKAEGEGADDNQSQAFYHPYSGEKNVLKFIADHTDHLPEWKREMMRLHSAISQNFVPNIRTKVLNEGFACITHYQTLETMFDIGLISGEMYSEFRGSHKGVTYQPPGYVMRKHPYFDFEEEVFIGSDINIYALGFAIFEDVKRICENPTEEDKEWFPDIAGKGNWVETSLHMMKHHTDETLIEQFLSPTVIRKFDYFILEGGLSNRFLEVSAVKTEDGFKKIRAQLAKDYRISDKIPKIHVRDYQQETDRCLVLQHDIVDDQPLEPKSAMAIMEMIHAQTKHPVVLESVNADGHVEAVYSSPEDYDYAPNRRTAMHYGMG